MAFLERNANSGSVSTGYDIDNSLKMESDNSEQLYATPWSSAGTRTKHTWSIWVKRTELGTRQMLFEGGTDTAVTTQLSLSFQTTDALEVRAGERINSVAGTVYRLTNRVFRDTAAWYHIVAAFDTTQGTANDRIKIWVNGVQETSFATTANPDQNTNLGLFAANAQVSVGVSANNGFYYNGYVTHPALVYNTQLNADSFGEFDNATGIWKPIDLSDVTFGAFSFWLKFENSSALGTDSSGEGHTFTIDNISAADQATDTPTNNFSTLNPLMGANLIPEYYTVTQGGTNQVSSKGGYGNSVGTIGVSKGKWYYEVKFSSNFNYGQIGIIDTASLNDENMNLSPGQTSYGISWFSGNGGVNKDGSYNGSAAYQNFPSYDHTDTIGCAIDVDNNKLYFHKNGTYGNSGDPTSGSTGTGAIPLSTAGEGTWHVSTNAYYGYAQTNQGGYTSATPSSAASDANGYGTFEYAPPSGYYAICTKNLEVYG